MASFFRTLAAAMPLPAWITRGDGERVLYTMGILQDAYAERARQALRARMPSLGPATALPLLGADRGVARGRGETDEHYAGRLREWRHPRGHRVRGSAFSLLTQVSEYFGGARCMTVDLYGTRHTRAADGTESYEYGTVWPWSAARDPAEWARFWLVLDLSGHVSAHPPIGDPDLWGGAIGSPGYTIGQTGLTQHDVRAVRQIVDFWKPANATPEWAIVVLDGAHWPPEPGADWDKWSARDPRYRYWSLAL